MNSKYKIISLAVASALLSACAGGGGGSSSSNNSVGFGGNSGLNTSTQNTSTGAGELSALSQADKAQAAGKNIYVGVIDTGITATAQGLQGKNISTQTIEGNKLVTSKDGATHGTSMAEIITSIAPEVAINSGGNSAGNYVYSETGAYNLLRAMQAGAKVDILNNSYGASVTSNDLVEVYGLNNSKIVEKNNTMGKYFQEFIKRGTLVVAGVGNDDKKLPNINSALPLVNQNLETGFIAVTAYDQITGSKTQNECGVAQNWCVTAPEIFTGYATGNKLQTTGGSSNATAYVSGLAAKIKSRYDWFTNEDLKNAILTTAEDRGAAGVDPVWGHGLVNANKALNGYARFDKQHVFNVDGVKKAYFFDNDISGTGGLTKKGNDILVMNGNNTYKGDTIIEQGELIANGNSVSRHRVKSGTVLSIGDSKNSIELGTIDNQGTLNVNSSSLSVNGNLNGNGGKINQAIGTKITINGSANLNSSVYNISGVKNGYVTKAGTTEILLTASNGISANNLTTTFASSVGELIKQKININGKDISVTTSRSSIGDVVRSKNDFTGRDRTVKDLDGLLDKIDSSKLQSGVIYNYTSNPASELVQSLLLSQNLSQTLFELSTETSKHVQEQSVRNKSYRGDKAIAQSLSAQDKGYVWIDAGFGTTKAKGLVDIHGESHDNTQTLGVSKQLGNDKHGLSAQLNHIDNQWSEKYEGVTKDVSLTGYGFETAYTYNPGVYWLGATLGYDRLKAKSAYGSDHGNQYALGLTLGKLFHWNKFSLMPKLGLKYTYLTDLDYTLDRVGNSDIQANNAKTREFAATAGLQGLWRVDPQGKLTLNLGLNIYHVLSGKTTFESNYGGYNVSTAYKTTGQRPDVDVYVGADYLISDNLKIFLNGGYEDGKYRNRKYINLGMGLHF